MSCVFFFSSRRRHTRCSRDWSSDVCSSDLALDRVTAVYEIYTSTMNDDEVQAIEREMAPKLAAFNDQIVQNKKLFERIAAVYEKRDGFDLNAEQKRLVWLDYTQFVRAGAKLDE